MDELTDLIVNELGSKALTGLPDLYELKRDIPFNRWTNKDIKSILSEEKCGKFKG